jgi:hypothetical protein
MTHMLLAFSLSLAAAVPVITLERGACFGACPIYKLEIFADGKVVYEGKDFVKRKGRVQGRITKAAVQQLVREFNRINYMRLDDEYVSEGPNCPEWWTDSPSAVTSINWKGQKKMIRHYHGCRGAKVLDQLTALEQKIDKAANTKRWVK